jgi:excisionase family DNA binding protein
MTALDSRIGPSDFTADELRNMVRLAEGGVRPVLLDPTGNPIALPAALGDVFVAILQAMQEKQAVVLLREDQALTSQAAADFLGVSRQYLVRLLEQGAIPFHRVGTHRRVLLNDLETFRLERSRCRKVALDTSTRELADAGLYDRFAVLERTDAER